MKLKAPRGVGVPCVAGVVIAARDGLYEVEAEIGALLIECFGFTAAALPEEPGVSAASRAGNPPLLTTTRRFRSLRVRSFILTGAPNKPSFETRPRNGWSR
jgi:hypothetical protein